MLGDGQMMAEAAEAAAAGQVAVAVLTQMQQQTARHHASAALSRLAMHHHHVLQTASESIHADVTRGCISVPGVDSATYVHWIQWFTDAV